LAGGTSASVALIVVALISVALIGGAKAEGSDPAAGAPFYANTFEKVPAAAALTALGRELFSEACVWTAERAAGAARRR